MKKFQPSNFGRKTNLMSGRVNSNGDPFVETSLKKASSKVLSTKTQEHIYFCLFWRITRPFIPLMICPFSSLRLVRERTILRGKTQRFLHRSKMISLQVFSCFLRGGDGIVSKTGKSHPLPELIRLQSLKKSARPCTEKKKQYDNDLPTTTV